MSMPNLEEYLGMFDSMVYNAGYEMDLSNPKKIVIRSLDKVDEMPVVYGDYDSDDTDFWFDPHMEFPKMLTDNTYYGNYESRLKDWTKAAKLADYLLKYQWAFDTEDKS